MNLNEIVQALGRETAKELERKATKVNLKPGYIEVSKGNERTSIKLPANISRSSRSSGR
jgi:hypothetical protein